MLKLPQNKLLSLKQPRLEKLPTFCTILFPFQKWLEPLADRLDALALLISGLAARS